MQKISKEHFLGWNIFPIQQGETKNEMVPDFLAWRGMYLFKEEKQTGDIVFTVSFMFLIKDEKLTKEQEERYNKILESGVCHNIVLIPPEGKDYLYLFESSNPKVETKDKKKKSKKRKV